jgi:poly(A) polymerase
VSAALDETALSALLDRPDLRRVLATLNGTGEETRIVGGAVRNALLGRAISDVDFATTATPETVKARAEAAGLRVLPTGIEHGTLTILVDGAAFEVTTLREDVETHGRHATVRFGRDFRADAERRDFTINALSVGADGAVHDYVGGLADLRAQRVAFIGDPATRIREDFLRILRFFRFHAEYGQGPLDRAGFAAALREREGLSILSRERIRVEFLKLLRARRAVEVIRELSDAGFAERVLGGVVEAGRLARVDAFERIEAQSRDPVRRLAGLAVMVAEDVERLQERFRLSNAEHDRLAAYARVLAAARSRGGQIGEGEMRRLVAEFGLGPVFDVCAAIAGEPRPQFLPEGRHTLQRYRSGEVAIASFPLRGADLLARGIAKGPEIGERLERARRVWLDEGCGSDEAARRRLIEVALAQAL